MNEIYLLVKRQRIGKHLCTKPLGVYSTYELAQRAKDNLLTSKYFSYFGIIPFQLNERLTPEDILKRI